MHTQLKNYFNTMDSSQFETYFSLLYTLYSVPNIVLPFFGGFFVDKLGPKICLIIFAGFIAAGQVIFALGLNIKSWPVMFVGRIIYGFGGESLGVGQSAILSEWFKGKEVAFAFGVSLSIARLGSVINNLVSPKLATSIGVGFALWFGAILCGSSVMCTIGIASVSKSFEMYMERFQSIGDASALLGGDNDEDEEADRLAADDIADDAPIGGTAVSTKLSTKTNRTVVNEVSFKDVLSFDHAFWILTVSCVVVYGVLNYLIRYPYIFIKLTLTECVFI